MSKDTMPLGKCADCGANMDLVGLRHNCRPRAVVPVEPPQHPIPAPRPPERREKKKLPPMQHPEGEPIVGAVLSDDAFGEQAGPFMRDGVEIQAPAMKAAKARAQKMADRAQLNVMIPRGLMKELKIAAVENEQTLESWIEGAVRERLGRQA